MVANKFVIFTHSLLRVLILPSLILPFFAATIFSECAFSGENCESFNECRTKFMAATKSLAISNARVDLQSLVMDSTEPDLTTSYISIEPNQTKRVLIISSGVHGVEGFVGSQLQQIFLNQIWPTLRDQQTALILIHAVNPWGFANLRRTTKHNVDLNRNFVLSDRDYKSVNAEYSQIQDFLNPNSAAKTGFFAGLDFVGEAIGKILMFGMTSLRKSILLGQYEHPKGIFFGGQQAEPQVKILEQSISRTIKEISSRAKAPLKILAIDLHTGYGERGRLHLLADQSELVGPATLNRIFGEENIDTGKQKEFYDVKGGYLMWLGRLARSVTNPKEFAALTFEFGTLDSQSTRGALDSLYRMQKENQSFFWGANSPEDQKRIQEFFLEMYNPSDSIWKNSASKAFESRIRQVWQKF